MGNVWVPVLVAVVTAVISFGSGMLLARDRARVDARAQYQLEARKRLYAAVGPLRYQLVVACRDAAARIGQLHQDPYLMDTTEYYGRNTLYRLLRPLALAELIQRQTNYVDFSVDPDVLQLGRFQAAAYETLTGDWPFLDLNEEQREQLLDWGAESQHVFKGRLEHAASALIVDDPPRCARFGEFDQTMADTNPRSGLQAFARLLETLWTPRNGKIDTFISTSAASVFWARLVSYGSVCVWLVKREGRTAGIEVPDYPVAEMIGKAADAQVRALAPRLDGALTSKLEPTSS